MASASPALTGEDQLVEWAGECYADPARFVMLAFPWQEPGPLKDHPGPDVWQREFLEDLGKEIRTHKGKRPYMPIRRAIASGHGIGKLQPYSLMLHTPTGNRAWGSLEVGDKVFGGDGKPTRITARHEQGVKAIWRVTFDDGSSTLCGLEHLWNVRGRSERRNGRDGWRTLKTEQILELGVKRSNGKVTARQWEIPRQGPAKWMTADLPIAPYLMGLWLGDGTKGVPEWTKPYPEPVENVRHLGYTVTERPDGKSKYVPGMVGCFRSMAVFECGSHERYVPEQYKYADVEQRRRLLAGLLDADGECSADGRVGYSTTSRRLADDVVWMARSLGAKAQIQPTIKHPQYTYNDEKRDGRPCWRVTLALDWNPFSIKHKAERWREPEARYLARWIDTIEYSHDEPAMCVTVAAPDGLYQTNDFIVTHNSTLVAWLVNWVMVTRPATRGTVSANTFAQLETKTWAAIQKWSKLSLFSHWFEVTAGSYYARGQKEDWACSPQSSKEENSEAFAGQHSEQGSSVYFFDEDSAIPDEIHRVAEGGLTDGEPMIFLFGNPTRNSGHFYRACFGSERHLWHPRSIDSRESRLTNKELIAEWVSTHGEDSDFVRVRVRGLPPRASDLQFIDQQRVWDAQKRLTPTVFDDEPLIAGVDVSDGGAAWNVVRFRRGSDARSIPPVRIPGEKVRGDRSGLLAKLADILTNGVQGRRVEAMFVDSAFGAPYVERLQAMNHRNVHEVRFGGESPDRHQANMRAYMWNRSKEWLSNGAIDPKDTQLETDATAPGYHLNKQDQLVIESKEDMAKRGVASPDDWDAHCLTFAAKVALPRKQPKSLPPPGSWMGL